MQKKYKNSTKPIVFEFCSKPVITSVENGQRLCTVVQKMQKIMHCQHFFNL